MSHALIVDDEPDIRELLELTLSRMGLKVTSARNVATAKDALTSDSFDLCLTDMRLPDGNGIELVEHVTQNFPRTPIAMITAYGNTEAAVKALKCGAFDFVSKPVDLNVLRALVRSALKTATQEPQPDDGLPNLIGQSVPMQRVRATISKLARSHAPVYISGESGVGKELAARLIHLSGARSDAPFVPVNCGAIPTELMESEFFGHTKGSFTGAVTDNQGLFQSANGGTLFLDEIAELPLHMQVKLLRVIQEKSVRPIGAAKEVAIDVRILSATHKDLEALVEDNEFRQDLYYRINVIELRMPSLRERPDDIEELTDHLLDRIAPEWSIERPEVDASAREALNSYAFPGNVRELHNILERAVTLCEGNVIHSRDLHLRPSQSDDIGAALSVSEVGLENYLAQIERKAIEHALEQCRYNKTAAAKKLGITFRALRYRLKKLEME
ncbi:MAG: type 4 fimbriae expression regulatory protein PilR [Lysobacteraceae bacterium]|nr:MAG: type 4 fimbriae expression regulatory protein PilR [Xanthomonadaceae bacterium]